MDFADFARRNEDRIAPETVRMLEPTDLVQLPMRRRCRFLTPSCVAATSRTGKRSRWP